MPIYEYQCQKCHHVCEVLQKAKDKPPEKCPKCGGAVAKLVSSPAIQFKGNGWYITDYAKKKAPSAPAKAEAKPAAESCASEGTKAKSDKSSE